MILQGKAETIDAYNAAMDGELRHALLQLGVVTGTETERKFRELDGDWWNSKRRVPDKFLVLKRNYNLDHNRLPTPVSYEKTAPYMLTMPAVVLGYQLSRLGNCKYIRGRRWNHFLYQKYFMVRLNSSRWQTVQKRRIKHNVNGFRNS